MDHVVATIHAFVIEQEVDVYRNGECIETQQCALKDLENVCYALCKKHNIDQLDLHGNQLYALHMRDDYASTKYSDFKINVNIV